MQWLNLEDNINLLALIGAILIIVLTVVVAGKYVGQMKVKKDESVELSEHNWDGIGEYKNPVPFGWAVVFLLTLVWAIWYYLLGYPLNSYSQIGEYNKEVKEANAKFEDFFESYTRNFRNDNLANIGQAVFPMLGILGTFISIAISMPSFSSSTANGLEKEIAILLNGVATAFYVSIYGIFLALWWMFFEKIGISKFERFYSEQKELSREFFWQENELNANFMKASVGYFKDSHDAFKMVLDDKFVKELSEQTNEKFNSLKELCEVEKNIINQSKVELSASLKMLNEASLKQDEFVKIHSDMLKVVSAFSNAFKDMEVKILTEHAKLGEIFSRNLNATKEGQLKFEQTIKSFDKVLREFSYSLMKEQNDALKEFRASLVESATIFKAAYEQEGRSLEREKERESLIAELKKNIDEIDKEANSVIEKIENLVQ